MAKSKIAEKKLSKKKPTAKKMTVKKKVTAKKKPTVKKAASIEPNYDELFKKIADIEKKIMLLEK